MARGGDRFHNLHRYVYGDRALRGLMQIVETPYGGYANCGDGFGSLYSHTQWGTSNDFRPLPSYRYRLINSIPLTGPDSAVRAAEITRGVSRERYVCLAGKNLAGFGLYRTRIKIFCSPHPPYTRSAYII